MADGHFPDVELLRRELAVLILEWAGKAVKDDPDGPMSTALTRAVSDAARGAVSEQHQALTNDAADRIAEALDRRAKDSGVILWRVSPWGLGLITVAAAALLALAFFLGLQAGRTEGALPETPATATAAPIAPLAPPADEPSRPVAAPATASPPRVERSTPALSKPAQRAAHRQLGRPAQASDEAPPRSAQPVGGAATSPAAPATPTTP